MLFSRGYPPEHIPGYTSLMERSETSSFTHLNHTVTTGRADDGGEEEGEEDTMEDSVHEQFERMKLDDSALSTAVTGKGAKVGVYFSSFHSLHSILSWSTLSNIEHMFMIVKDSLCS